MAFGGNVFGWTVDEPTSFALLDAFVAAGFNLIDTADMYSTWVKGHKGGESETIIGKWLKRSGNRAKVVIAALDDGLLEGAVEAIRKKGTGPICRNGPEGAAHKLDLSPFSALPADITEQDQVDALFAQTLDRFGRLDVLVNNAGRSMRGKLADTTPEQFRDLMELNLLALVRCTRAALPHLLAQRGHVVNIGSLASKSAARWVGAYPATKFAVAAYTQQLRLELTPEGLHVLLVCPGPIARAGAWVCRDGGSGLPR